MLRTHGVHSEFGHVRILHFAAEIPMRVATGGGHWNASPSIPPVAAGAPTDENFADGIYMPQIKHLCVVSIGLMLLGRT